MAGLGETLGGGGEGGPEDFFSLTFCISASSPEGGDSSWSLSNSMLLVTELDSGYEVAAECPQSDFFWAGVTSGDLGGFR